MCKHDHQWHYFSEIVLIDKKILECPYFLKDRSFAVKNVELKEIYIDATYHEGLSIKNKLCHLVSYLARPGWKGDPFFAFPRWFRFFPKLLK